MAIDKLIEAIDRLNNPTVAGLDTRLDYLPEEMVKKATSLEAAADAIHMFNMALIDALEGVVPAVKVQAAYYEMYGPEGMKVFADTLDYAHKKGMIVIADAKRGDIGATAGAYAEAFLGSTKFKDGYDTAFACDFLTVNPYFGSEGVSPFIDKCKQYGKGIFVLVKTSNPTSGELQDLALADGRTVYTAVAELVKTWGESSVRKHGYSSVGAVVGATYPEQGAQLRKLMPQTFFLVPGYGAQGAGANDIKGCFDKSGGGAIVNASRSLLLAYRKTEGLDFAEAARLEAIRMRNDINAALGR
jgi:orotidine-5'-phosphate decarboxylase